MTNLLKFQSKFAIMVNGKNDHNSSHPCLDALQSDFAAPSINRWELFLAS